MGTDADGDGCWANFIAFSKKELLLTLTLLGVALGVLVGIAANAAAPSRLAVTFLGFPGEVLMRLLQMMVLPLIAGSMIAGVCSLSSSGAKSGKLAKITLFYYMGSTIIAVVLGIVLVNIIQPGVGRSLLQWMTILSTIRGLGGVKLIVISNAVNHYYRLMMNVFVVIFVLVVSGVSTR